MPPTPRQAKPGSEPSSRLISPLISARGSHDSGEGQVQGKAGPHVWFQVPASSTRTLWVEYTPLALESVAFELPLLFKGLAVRDLPDGIRGVLRRVVAAGALPPLASSMPSLVRLLC